MTLHLKLVAHFRVAIEFLVVRRRPLLFVALDSERDSSDRDDSDRDAASFLLLEVVSLLLSYVGCFTSSVTPIVREELNTERQCFFIFGVGPRSAPRSNWSFTDDLVIPSISVYHTLTHP